MILNKNQFIRLSRTKFKTILFKYIKSIAETLKFILIIKK